VGRTSYSTETEDVGPLGCQLVVPMPMSAGQAVRVIITAPEAGAPLAVAATIAWTSSRAPWRIGLAFDAAAHTVATRWWDKLVASHPGLASFRRVPDRLPLDAMVYLGPPPRFTDFTAEELQVLSRVANGTTVSDLQARLGDGWAVGRRMLFALLSRGLLTLSKSAASHVGAWRQVLRDAGTSFEESERPVPTVTRSWLEAVVTKKGGAAPGERTTPQPAPAAPKRATEATPTEATPPEAMPLESVVEPPPMEPPGHHAPAGQDASAGTGWRGVKRERNPDAQRAFELGKAELASGRARSAVALFRMALQHSPGDEDIAAELAKALKG
jgi:hypothetical protein